MNDIQKFKKDKFKKGLNKKINEEFKNELFLRHCKETATQLGISDKIVEDVLRDKSIKINDLVVESFLAKLPVRINVLGWFIIRTKIKIKQNGKS